MRKIVALELNDPVPEDARPVGIATVTMQPQNPWQAPWTKPIFYYDVPAEAAKKEKKK